LAHFGGIKDFAQRLANKFPHRDLKLTVSVTWNLQGKSTSRAHPPKSGVSQAGGRTPVTNTRVAGTGAHAHPDPASTAQTEPVGQAPGPAGDAPHEAAGTKQLEGAATDSRSDTLPLCPDDWVCFGPAGKSLGRIERQMGSRFLVWVYKKSYGWNDKPIRISAEKILRRLAPEEVWREFPGADEAWATIERDAATVPVPCPPSKVVYEPRAGGPKLLKVWICGAPGDASRVKFVLCNGGEAREFPTLQEAKEACDRVAGQSCSSDPS